MISNLVKVGALFLALGTATACGSTPDDAAGARSDDDGGATGFRAEAIVKGPICNASVCNAACTEQPGVSGGHCVGSDCLCNAHTCGQFGQAPCAGNDCSQGHYDAWLNVCDDCGTTGATCCDLDHPGATTSCYGGLFCQGGTVCRACGGNGQDPCEPAQGDAFCSAGLVVAVSAGETVCASSCGSVGQLPCADGGCTELDAVLLASSPDCQWTLSCGHAGQSCCDAGSVFQNPSPTQDLCHDGSGCYYMGLPPFGGWNCSFDGLGGSGVEGSTCDPTTEDCPDSVHATRK